MFFVLTSLPLFQNKVFILLAKGDEGNSDCFSHIHKYRHVSNVMKVL